MGPEIWAFAEELQELFLAENKTVALEGIEYPAAILPELTSYPTNGGRPIQQTITHPGYFASVTEGRDAMIARLASIPVACGGVTKVILAGYSQGADVIGRTVETLRDSPQHYELNWIAGIALFGDPAFNGTDRQANTGTYHPDRDGIFGPRDHWSDLIDVPVVSSACRYPDPICQLNLNYTITHTSYHVPLETPRRERFYDLPTIMRDLELKYGEDASLFREHAMYDPAGDVSRAAVELASQLGLSNEAQYGDSPPLDLAILIDSTASSSDVIPELQVRATDIVHLVTENVRGARVAVIDYKGGSIGPNNPYIVNVRSPFTSDASDAINAIGMIEAGGGPYGAIYSAVNAAKQLDWRAGARRMTLTLSTSRVCAQQYCNIEAGSGVQAPGFDGPWALPLESRPGVVTYDNLWFFESAGWGEAIHEPFLSRPGVGHSATHYLDEFERVLRQAVTNVAEPVLGTTRPFVGQTGSFNGNAMGNYFASSSPRNLQWSSTYIGPIDDGGGVSMSSRAEKKASGAGILEVHPLDEQPPPPVDMGPFFDVHFDQPGLHELRLEAYVDDELKVWTTYVEVQELPKSEPAAPLLQSYVLNDMQVLWWSAGDGEAALGYHIVDSEDQVLARVMPEEIAGPDGAIGYEYGVPLQPGTAPTYSVRAMNLFGETPAIPLIPAWIFSYEETSDGPNDPPVRMLRLAGPSTPELEAIGQELGSGTDIQLSGDYVAHLVSPSGDRLLVDMSTADASIDIDSQWALSWELGEISDSSGQSVGETMADGFADEMMVGGYVELELNDKLVRFNVQPQDANDPLLGYVLDPNSAAPVGLAVGGVQVSSMDSAIEATYVGEFDIELVPFAANAVDPEFDWSTLEVENVRTWVGDKEVSHSITAVELFADGVGNGEDDLIEIRLIGDVASGQPAAMRAFLEDGTISFDTGSFGQNAMSFSIDPSEALDLFPDIAESPRIVGSLDRRLTQYEPANQWSPVIAWGSGGVGMVNIEGALPIGLSFDWWTKKLTGTPLETGVFPITVIAQNDVGLSTREATIEVSVSSITRSPELSIANLEDAGGGTINLSLEGRDWYRPDNTSIYNSLPIIDQFTSLNGFLWGSVDSVEFVDETGAEFELDGDFNIDMYRGWSPEKDFIDVYGSNVSVNLPGTAVEDLIAAGGSIKFAFQSGGVNLFKVLPYGQ